MTDIHVTREKETAVTVRTVTVLYTCYERERENEKERESCD